VRPPRLAIAPAPDAWPEVVAVIPARNEAETIGRVVGAHFGSRYEGSLTVVVVDDHSTDHTAEIAFRAAAGADLPASRTASLEDRTFLTRFSSGRAFGLVSAPPLAEGWTGKMAAVNAGLAYAREIAPSARFVLLADADIAPAPQTLSMLVALAENRGLALASLMARLDARGIWGGLLIPAFVFFFQKLYPFHRASTPGDRIAAAAGGCMLVRRDALEDIGGVETIRDRLIDDCALAAAIKGAGRRIWIGLAKNEVVSLRDNRELHSIWSMVARTAFVQLDRNWLYLLGAVAGMALLYLAPPLIALGYPAHRDGAAAIVAAAAWGLMAVLYLPTARLYDQASWKTFFLPTAAFLYILMTITSALNDARGEGGLWKGRVFPA
jgi:hopene-associated glycosyltransferase HpnB